MFIFISKQTPTLSWSAPKSLQIFVLVVGTVPFLTALAIPTAAPEACERLTPNKYPRLSHNELLTHYHSIDK